MDEDNKKDQSYQFGGVSEHKLFYEFGGIKAYDLKEIEKEVLSESVYLDVFAGSDENLKTEITPLENTLDKVLKLSTVNFKWKKEEFPELKLDDRKHIGFLAQEIQEHFPQLVKETDGHLSVNYMEMVPVLLSSVKELSSALVATYKRVEKLERQINQRHDQPQDSHLQ